LQTHLDLFIGAGEEVELQVTGSSAVHVTGSIKALGKSILSDEQEEEDRSEDEQIPSSAEVPHNIS